MIGERAVALPAGWGRRLFSAESLQRFGDALQRRQDIVRRIQWAMVGIYLFLLIVPVALPASGLAKAAEILFWGVWWPGVILSMLFFGQFWCGLLCPDGTLTEFASRHGRGGKIPAWLRWAGWPPLLFSVVTVYEHLINAYRHADAALLTVGGMSLLALACGCSFGRGKRIWCRYACPGSSMFSLLARCALFHFKVDRVAWDLAPRPQPKPVDCPLLLDVRRLRSNEKCNMCGRCSGHRRAVALSWRLPGHELETLEESEVRLREAFGIVFVLIGLCYGVMHWQGSVLHGWLLTEGQGWLSAPVSGWFFRQVDAGQSVGDALAGLGTMLGLAILLGGAASLMLLIGVRGDIHRAAYLAYGLIPLGGLGLFLGALEHTFGLLVQAGFAVGVVMPWLRGVVLLGALAWSLRIGRMLQRQRAGGRGEGASYLATVLLLAASYQLAP